ncbi:MAG: DUF4258 domain-containing protein [Candidatus Hydrogenedentes bacterium]|nr:DUF4258 domain-containing protein [Candidatus Hydrogenedentota bacterium]
MNYASIEFSVHAVQRMFERGIGTDAVVSVVQKGEVIAKYDNDTPFPGVLLCGNRDDVTLHVVVGPDRESDTARIIIVYVPSLDLWEDGYKTRKKNMKCVLCREGDTDPGKVTVTLERGGAVIVIKEVPAEVCGNCGEYYLTEEITRKVLHLAETSIKKGVEVEVIRFAA